MQYYEILTLENPRPLKYAKATVETVPATEETDAEIIERLRIRFDVLEQMARATKQGYIKALIISGPTGVGKSFIVNKVLRAHEFMSTLAETPLPYEIIKGEMSSLLLYSKLYEYRHKGNVFVLDDCDVWTDESSLSILKAALDSNGVRTIHWAKDSRFLKSNDIPNSFDYEGSCIFITNVQLDHFRSKKILAHVEALKSRSHFLNLTIQTDREKMLRIKQLVSDGMLSHYGFTQKELCEIVDFVSENKHQMQELSLRMVLKVADLRKAIPANWRQLARFSCME